jgi:hypothetical protein
LNFLVLEVTSHGHVTALRAARNDTAQRAAFQTCIPRPNEPQQVNVFMILSKDTSKKDGNSKMYTGGFNTSMLPMRVEDTLFSFATFAPRAPEPRGGDANCFLVSVG